MWLLYLLLSAAQVYLWGSAGWMLHKMGRTGWGVFLGIIALLNLNGFLALLSGGMFAVGLFAILWEAAFTGLAYYVWKKNKEPYDQIYNR